MLANVVGWQLLLRLYVAPIYATLILLGVNLVIAVTFALLAGRSSPSHAEQDALRIRRDALEGAQSSLAFAVALPTIGAFSACLAGRTQNGGPWAGGGDGNQGAALHWRNGSVCFLAARHK